MKTDKNFCTPKAFDLARKLHLELSLSDKDWHQLKSNSKRRAAELFAGALVQLIEGGKTEDVEALANHGIAWIKGNVKDPGCPKH